jgi:hypothetical protein
MSFVFSSLHSSSFALRSLAYGVSPACAWQALLAYASQKIIYNLTTYLCLRLRDEPKFKELYPTTSILSMKAPSGISATTVQS